MHRKKETSRKRVGNFCNDLFISSFPRAKEKLIKWSMSKAHGIAYLLELFVYCCIYLRKCSSFAHFWTDCWLRMFLTQHSSDCSQTPGRFGSLYRKSVNG